MKLIVVRGVGTEVVGRAMQNVILAVHILACIALTIVILLQRSEGGALGIGGGGGGGLMSGRAAASALVRTTMIFGGMFMLTTLALTTIANQQSEQGSEVAVEYEESQTTAPIAPEITQPPSDILEQPAVTDIPVDVPAEEDVPANDAQEPADIPQE